MSNRRDFFKQALVLPLVGRLLRHEEVEPLEPVPVIEDTEATVAWEASCQVNGEYMIKIGDKLMELKNAVFHWGDGIFHAKQSVEIDAVYYGDASWATKAYKSTKSLPFVISTFMDGDTEYRGECYIGSIEIGLSEEMAIISAFSLTETVSIA